MKRRRMVGVLVTGLLALPAAPALAAPRSGDQLERATALDSPSVVMVYYSASAMLQDSRDGSMHGPYDVQWRGSGFFVSGDGYIVTAAHVAAPSQDDLKKMLVEPYLAEDARAAGCESAGSCSTLADSHRTSYLEASRLVDPHVDVRVLTQEMDASPAMRARAPAAEVKAVSPWGQRDIAVLKISGKDEPVLPLADSSGVQVEDRIAVLGYPGPADTDLRIVPRVTTGAITSKSRGPDAGVAAGVNLFQTQAAVEQGDSGGPAINALGQVVGLVSFKTDATQSFLISSADIRDLVDHSGAHNSLGQIDQLWRQGLGYMDQHRYAKAKAAFDRCSALNKAQVGCATTSRQASRLLGRDEEWRFAWWRTLPPAVPAALAGLAALVLALVVAAGLLVLRRRRTAPIDVPGEGVVAPVGRQLPPGLTSQARRSNMHK
jgi:S1-C subfamily serine protease